MVTLTLGLRPDLKNEPSSFVMIFDALSNAAYRVSPRGPGAEIGGGSQPPPPADGGKSRGPAGRGLTLARTWGGGVDATPR